MKIILGFLFHSALNQKLNLKLVLECKNSDGLTGFNFSHDGYWNACEFFGETTPLECAKACTQGCVAIDTGPTGRYDPLCYHYKNKEDITDANKVIFYGFKAYIKC